MKVRMCFLAAFFSVVFFGGAASGDVTVSVTISGSLDEMLPILEHLREVGFGVHRAGNEALRLEIHSDASAPDSPAAELSEQPEPRMTAFMAEPGAVRPGGRAWLSILVLNGAGIVDTVSATFIETGQQIELYDNGENGDPVAGDGQWSANTVIDPELAPGRHALRIVAFNANGQPVLVKCEDGQPVELAADVTLEVVD